MTEAERLKSFVERIERLEDDARDIGTDKRDVFDEAHKAGFDKKAVRRILRDRKEAAKDKGTAALVEQYAAMLAMPGASYRGVAERVGVSKSKLQRLVPRKNSGTPHDPDTGEIRETPGEEAPPVAAVTSTPEHPAGQAGAAAILADDWDAINGTHPHQLRGAA